MRSRIARTAGSQPPHRVAAPVAACTSARVHAPRCTALTIVRSRTASQWQISAMARMVGPPNTTCQWVERPLGANLPAGSPTLGAVSGGFIVLFVVVAGAAVLISWLVEQAKRKRAAALAVAHGLQYLPGPTSPPDVPFQQFSVGRSRRVRHTFWRDGDPYEATVFEYQYTTGSGKNSQTHHCTCAMFRTGLRAPHLVLDRQGFFRDLLGKLGLRDIQLESPEFNSTWHVSCDDERFAVTLLDPPMMGWLMTVGGAGSIEIELLGDRGLAITRRLDVEEMPALLDHVHRFVVQIPKVVHELYSGYR